jgi:hypothetical protein
MNKKAIVSEKGKPGEKINRFIIECMFNKYFEEEKESIVCGQSLDLVRLRPSTSLGTGSPQVARDGSPLDKLGTNPEHACRTGRPVEPKAAPTERVIPVR